MKKFAKRMMGITLALLMVLSTGVPAFAEEGFISLAPIEETPFEEPEEIIPEEELFEEEPEIYEEIEFIEEEQELLYASSENSLEDIIRRQVEAYVKSIDIADADGRAKDAVAKHGITGKGKKLSVKEGHVLTATLYNSNMMKDMLTESCYGIIKAMQQMDIANVKYAKGGCDWKTSKSAYSLYMRTADGNNVENRNWLVMSRNPYEGEFNSYDNSLILIAGNIDVKITAERAKVTKTETTYKMTCRVIDRFDFDTNAGIGSLLGALFFKEYDWESAISFNLTVPYKCSHISGNYRFVLDEENFVLESEESEEFTANGTTRYSYVNSSGVAFYYYETEDPIRLCHNKPWVLEYDVADPKRFALAPVENAYTKTYPILEQDYGGTLFFTQFKYGSNENEYNYCGTKLSFPYSKAKPHTFRLENAINPDGSNTVYLTVINLETGKILLEKTPMDDCYKKSSVSGSSLELESSSDNRISGTDIFINYIGNRKARLDVKDFELRVWENGKEAATQSCFTEKVIKPTCTEKGSATHTCTLCGYSYTEEIAAKDHSLGEWSLYAEPTVGKAGEERRTCANCDYYESKEIAAYRYGDVNCDGKVNTIDANYVRRYAAGLLTLDERQLLAANVSGDESVDVIDANMIRRYVVKSIDAFPAEV